MPLTVGGGIRGFTDAEGRQYSALDVAAEYFRSGADKVSIGSDAVDAAQEYLRTGKKTGQTAIEQISWVLFSCFIGLHRALEKALMIGFPVLLCLSCMRSSDDLLCLPQLRA